MWRRVGSGIAQDVRGRIPHYVDDWTVAAHAGLRILAPTTYIWLASLLPALAFGQQLASETEGTLNVVHVLVATALSGTIQSVIGGQPLLIIGVAEPIVLIYSFMYQFAEQQQTLGKDLFLPWAAWVCVWTAVEVALLALLNACKLIDRFTRFSGELFGMLIAVLFLQQAIKGLIAGFRLAEDIHPGAPEADDFAWRLVNGLFGVILALGLLLTALLTTGARGSHFGNAVARGLLADYGAALMVLAWSGLSFALKGVPRGVPRRVSTRNTWDVKDTWYVTERMTEVPGAFIAGALVPATIIAVLFYFDHSVSAQLAQQKEYNLTKPPAYHYDLLLLAGMTLMCGLLGLPPVNGVLPQAPMHTRSLATLRRQMDIKTLRRREKDDSGSKDSRAKGGVVKDDRVKDSGLQPAAMIAPAAAAAMAAVTAAPMNGEAAAAAMLKQEPGQQEHYHYPPPPSPPSPPPQQQQQQQQQHVQLPQQLPQRLQLQHFGGTHEVNGISNVRGVGNSRGNSSGSSGGDGGDGGLSGEKSIGHLSDTLPLQVLEQRVTNLLQSLAVAACLGATPAIKQIPEAVLWGYFAYMALESLPGSQFWERLLLLVTDPKRRRQILLRDHPAYLETVPFVTIVVFTALQFAYLAGVWALVTWAGIGGVAFPIPIMALVPIRMYLLPRFFSPSNLQELDAIEYEEAPPLPLLLDSAAGGSRGALRQLLLLGENRTRTNSSGGGGGDSRGGRGCGGGGSVVGGSGAVGGSGGGDSKGGRGCSGSGGSSGRSGTSGRGGRNGHGGGDDSSNGGAGGGGEVALVTLELDDLGRPVPSPAHSRQPACAFLADPTAAAAAGGFASGSRAGAFPATAGAVYAYPGAPPPPPPPSDTDADTALSGMSSMAFLQHTSLPLPLSGGYGGGGDVGFGSSRPSNEMLRNQQLVPQQQQLFYNQQLLGCSQQQMPVPVSLQTQYSSGGRGGGGGGACWGLTNGSGASGAHATHERLLRVSQHLYRDGSGPVSMPMLTTTGSVGGSATAATTGQIGGPPSVTGAAVAGGGYETMAVASPFQPAVAATAAAAAVPKALLGDGVVEGSVAAQVLQEEAVASSGGTTAAAVAHSAHALHATGPASRTSAENPAMHAVHAMGKASRSDASIAMHATHVTGPGDDERELIEQAHVGLHVKHHLDRNSLRYRGRQQQQQAVTPQLMATTQLQQQAMTPQQQAVIHQQQQTMQQQQAQQGQKQGSGTPADILSRVV